MKRTLQNTSMAGVVLKVLDAEGPGEKVFQKWFIGEN